LVVYDPQEADHVVIGYRLAGQKGADPGDIDVLHFGILPRRGVSETCNPQP
jgi:hypothetical protein